MRSFSLKGSYLLLFPALLVVSICSGSELERITCSTEQTDAGPPVEFMVHNIGNMVMPVSNAGIWGDPQANYPTLEWPYESLSSYMYYGGLWSCCYGVII